MGEKVDAFCACPGTSTAVDAAAPCPSPSTAVDAAAPCPTTCGAVDAAANSSTSTAVDAAASSSTCSARNCTSLPQATTPPRLGKTSPRRLFDMRRKSLKSKPLPVTSNSRIHPQARCSASKREGTLLMLENEANQLAVPPLPACCPCSNQSGSTSCPNSPTRANNAYLLPPSADADPLRRSSSFAHLRQKSTAVVCNISPFRRGLCRKTTSPNDTRHGCHGDCCQSQRPFSLPKSTSMKISRYFTGNQSNAESEEKRGIF